MLRNIRDVRVSIRSRQQQAGQGSGQNRQNQRSGNLPRDQNDRQDHAAHPLIGEKEHVAPEADHAPAVVNDRDAPLFIDLETHSVRHVRAHRDLLGPTNSNDAPAGTIRGDFGTDIERNAAHGSDAAATARIEISYFFGAPEILAPVEAL